MTELPLKMVPFSKLAAIDEINARGKSKDGLDELAASIAAKGLIQPLAVRPGDNGKFEVIDGRRRYMALAKLVKDGSMKKADLVPVIERNETDSEALETSLVANTQRKQMHEVEEIETFQRLVDAGMTEQEIASRHAVPTRTVRQRLKLANLAPSIRLAWKLDKIDRETAHAFARHDNPAVQAELYETLRKKNGGRIGVFNVNAALSQTRVLAKDCEALEYVGETAYLAAGGKFSESLFDDDNFVEDLPLAKKLAREKLKLEADRLIADGWQWAVAYLDGDEQDIRRYQCDDIDEDAPHEDAEGYYSAAQKAASGVIVELTASGELDYEFGLVKRKALLPGAALANDDEDDDDAEDDGDEPGTNADPALSGDEDDDDALKISGALMRTISEALTVATAAALERQPSIALRAAVATLISSGFSQPVKLTKNGWPTEAPASVKFAAVFSTLEGVSVEGLLDRLGILVAQALDMRTYNGAGPSEDDRALVAAIAGESFTLEARKVFNAVEYFTRASKAIAIDALEEIREAGKAEGLAPEDVIADMKKSELADAAANFATRSGWLPPELRHPTFKLGFSARELGLETVAAE